MLEVFDIYEKPDQLVRSSGSSKKTDKLITEYLAIEAESAKEAGMLAFMARAMIMATLPHSKLDADYFQRWNGDYVLTIQANPVFGMPYGSLPRLLLAWITREAKRTKSHVLHLGKSFSEFLRALDLSRSGGKRGDATRLRDQMLRLFSSHISCVYQDKKNGVCKADQFQVARSFELWWNPLKDNQCNISKQSTITLSKDFFEEIIDRPVPIDLRVLQALRKSPLQIDIYTWLTYRFFSLKKSTLIPWISLKNQFGSNYAENRQGLRDFKREFIRSLRVVTAFYNEAKVSLEDDGINLNPSRSHIKNIHQIGVH